MLSNDDLRYSPLIGGVFSRILLVYGAAYYDTVHVRRWLAGRIADGRGGEVAVSKSDVRTYHSPSMK